MWLYLSYIFGIITPSEYELRKIQRKLNKHGHVITSIHYSSTRDHFDNLGYEIYKVPGTRNVYEISWF